MRTRAMIAAGALAAALVVPAAAEAAWSGFAALSVNLRTGPGTGHAGITVVPAGARLTVFQCFSWCQVRFAGITGWVSARYVAGGGPGYYGPGQVIVGGRPGYYGQGQIVVGPPPSYWDPGLPRPYRPWFRPYRPGVNIWLGF